MKLSVVARDPDDQKMLEARVKKRRHSLSKKPSVVLACGGDGTLLIAERAYPGIPKLLLKDSAICNTCPGYEHPVDELLDKLANEEYSLEEYAKLNILWERSGRSLGEWTCTNECSIRNQLPIQALRFSLYVDEEPVLEEELIGDGVVIATPFGSGGYYHSITKSTFEEGIGIALNNCRVPQRGVHTGSEKTIKVVIKRMGADLVCDNDPGVKTLEPGDSVIVTASAQKMKMVKI